MSNIGTRFVLSDDGPDISGSSFVIKDYQRGYRWEKQQVISLLQDLKDFNDNNHTVRYCMQPLVVKKINATGVSKARELSKIINSLSETDVKETGYFWELIDGQQRLTTTLLILDSCNSNLRTPPKLPYSIYYALVRDIDEYYIKEARATIDAWFEKFGDKQDDVKGEIKRKINSDIEFIWYEVDPEANSVDIFIKLNIGKIPLTNAELFKAQLLNPDKAPEEVQKNLAFQIDLTQIAFEWDKIEQSLRDNEFWSFISNEHQDGETRIDYLLRLYAIQLKQNELISDNISENDNLFPFIAINEYIRKYGKTSLEIWEEVVNIHDKLKSWYADGDNKLYHYIGFLIAVDKSNIRVITELIKQSKGKRKSEVEELVFSYVCNEMRNVRLSELSYQKDGAKIRKVLLLFNLQTLIQSKTDNRFSFKQYKDPDTHWDIEHIHARATDEEIRAIKLPEKRAEFLRTLSKQFVDIGDNSTVEEIELFIETEVLPGNINDDIFLEFCCCVTDKYGDFDENGLGNLTLLDSETNRSYHNALYPIKRLKIIERDKGDVFVPVCTKNVFLKMYSSKLNNMMAWTKDDADDYLKEIIRVLVEEAKVCQ